MKLEPSIEESDIRLMLRFTFHSTDGETVRRELSGILHGRTEVFLVKYYTALVVATTNISDTVLSHLRGPSSSSCLPLE